MYLIVIATMLSNAEPTLPVLVSGYSTLSQCRLELVDIAKIDGFDLVISPFVGYSVVKMKDNKSVLAFCVKDIRNI